MASFRPEKVWDTAVVGAGAAGLMAAITARRLGLSVLLLDGKEKIGAKILMSGGTRCNVTNLEVTEKDFESEEKPVLGAVLRAFPSARAVKFFDELGVALTLEPGGKFFPITHSAKTVLEALLKEVERSGVSLVTPRKVKQVFFHDPTFSIEGDHFSYQAKTVILATGGLSHPGTGSDGVGYEIAKSFGHRLIQTRPALTPFLTDDPDWKKLTGVALPAGLALWMGGKKKISYEDSFLFTHFGFSGPAALNMSRHWLYHQNHGAKLTADFLPALGEEQFRKKLSEQIHQRPTQSLKNFLDAYLPRAFAETVLKKLRFSGTLILNQLKREEREALVHFLFSCPLRVTGVIGYQKAEATAGGVDLARVNKQTLESKLRSGLFFAGEMLDVDGKIGGFNFQWAWSSGFVAAQGVRKRVLPK